MKVIVIKYTPEVNIGTSKSKAIFFRISGNQSQIEKNVMQEIQWEEVI